MKKRSSALLRVSAIAVTVTVASTMTPGAAFADENPYPKDPYYFSKDELPDLGLPWELSRDPALPTSADYLKSGEPTCSAPSPLPGTDSSSAEGFTLPIQIKITNGIMLAGYSPAAAHWNQPVPFSLRLHGLTGWVNARFQIPSMKLLVETSDVTMCDGANLAVAGPASAPYPGWSDWAPWTDINSGWGTETDADGKEVAVPPGTFNSLLYSDASGAAPGRKLVIENVIAKSVDASVTGIAPSGELQLSVDLDLDLDVVRGDHAPSVQLPLGMKGTFSTAVKAPLAPAVTQVPWDVGSPLPQKHDSYLPTKNLPGAEEGAMTTIGSTDASIDVSRLNMISNDTARGIAASLYIFLYGIDPWGNGIVYDEPDGTAYYSWSGGIAQKTEKFFTPDRGIADVSADMTISKLGLPKGVPSGYGFG